LPSLTSENFPELFDLNLIYGLIELNARVAVGFPDDSPEELHAAGGQQNILPNLGKARTMQTTTFLRDVSQQCDPGLIQGK
jgi:hypothetical protein